MPVNWDEIIDKAKSDTDKKFQTKISSLTSMTDKDIQAILKENNFDKENLAAVLKEIDDAAKSNKDKAAAIAKISKGVEILVSIAAKVI